MKVTPRHIRHDEVLDITAGLLILFCQTFTVRIATISNIIRLDVEPEVDVLNTLERTPVLLNEFAEFVLFLADMNLNFCIQTIDVAPVFVALETTKHILKKIKQVGKLKELSSDSITNSASVFSIMREGRLSLLNSYFECGRFSSEELVVSIVLGDEETAAFSLVTSNYAPSSESRVYSLNHYVKSVNLQ